MRWTTEKKATWIKTRLAFGAIHTHRVMRGADTHHDHGFARTWHIRWYRLTVNRRGQLVNKLEEHQNAGWRCFSLTKAVRMAKEGRAPADWLHRNPGINGFRADSVFLQTRGILPPYVIDILFDRLRNRAA